MIVRWTDERVAELTRMWENGLSASEIAERLGSVTRNAVIGKRFRLGLCDKKRSVHPLKSTKGTPDGKKVRRLQDALSRQENGFATKLSPAEKAERQKQNRAMFAATKTSKTSVAYRKHLPRIPEMSKSQLRDMLHAAVENTR